MIHDRIRPDGFRANERAAGVRIGRFVLRHLTVRSEPGEYLPIFQHCTVLRAEWSHCEGGIEYTCLSPLFDPLTVDPDSCITDRDVPRYEWEFTVHPDTRRIYAAYPIRVS